MTTEEKRAWGKVSDDIRTARLPKGWYIQYDKELSDEEGASVFDICSPNACASFNPEKTKTLALLLKVVEGSLVFALSDIDELKWAWHGKFPAEEQIDVDAIFSEDETEYEPTWELKESVAEQISEFAKKHVLTPSAREELVSLFGKVSSISYREGRDVEHFSEYC